jgi:serine/threonine protein kinase
MIHQTYLEQHDAPFTYRKLLGSGSSGVVEQVQRKQTSEVYARKSINLPRRTQSRTREAENQAKIRKIEEEARIIRRLRNNPHIVEVVETYAITSRVNRPLFCIILLPVAESDLKDVITDVGNMPQGPLKDKAIHKMRHWAACLVRATDYMHDRRVKHKDIKPGNILIRGEDIWITDFGIAKDFLEGESESSATHFDGTRAYCPLDKLEGKRVGKACDIFSLGCCFLEMATVIIADQKLDVLKDLRRDRPYAEAQGEVLRWIFYLFSVLAARKKLQTNGYTESTALHAASDPGRAILLPALALLMMDPDPAQRITARQLVILISVLQEDMYCGKCRVGVPKEDPIHGLHSKFKSRGSSPELQYPPDPEEVLRPGFAVPTNWEEAKRHWLKDHMWWL